MSIVSSLRVEKRPRLQVPGETVDRHFVVEFEVALSQPNDLQKSLLRHHVHY